MSTQPQPAQSIEGGPKTLIWAAASTEYDCGSIEGWVEPAQKEAIEKKHHAIIPQSVSTSAKRWRMEARARRSEIDRIGAAARPLGLPLLFQPPRSSCWCDFQPTWTAGSIETSMDRTRTEAEAC